MSKLKSVFTFVMTTFTFLNTILTTISLILKQTNQNQTFYFTSLSNLFSLSDIQTQIVLIILSIVFLWLTIYGLAKMNKKRIEKKQYPFYYGMDMRRPDGTFEVTNYALLWKANLYRGGLTYEDECSISAKAHCIFCKSELIETQSYFGKYLSRCPKPNCTFKVKGNQNNYTLSKLTEQELNREKPWRKQKQNKF